MKRLLKNLEIVRQNWGVPTTIRTDNGKGNVANPLAHVKGSRVEFPNPYVPLRREAPENTLPEKDTGNLL